MLFLCFVVVVCMCFLLFSVCLDVGFFFFFFLGGGVIYVTDRSEVRSPIEVDVPGISTQRHYSNCSTKQ